MGVMCPPDMDSPSGPAPAAPASAPQPALSIVLPIYNEELVLESTLAELIPFLEGLERSFEVVCVDDGSQDASLRLLEEAAQRDPRVRACALAENRGKGAAVREGMGLAQGQLQVFMDADLSTPLAELPGLLGALDAGYDVVLGNRRAPGSHIERRQPWLRQTLGKGFTFLTQQLLAPGVHDFTCGFKGFRLEASRTIFSRSTLNGWAFDAELVVIASVHSLKLAQVPVRWHHEDDTKVRLAQAVFGSAWELSRIFVRRATGGYR